MTRTSPTRWSRSQRLLALGVVACTLLVAVGALALLRPSPKVEASTVLRWGYHVTWDDASHVSAVSHANMLDVVSPYWYHLTPNGSIKAFPQADVYADLRAQGIMVVPLIQNESKWDEFRTTIETPAKRDAIVASLVQLVETQQYDGIQIDFEGVNAADSVILTDFMERLWNAFHPRGWMVSQAVIARTSNTSTTWGGAYDYKELQKYNDYIVVMAYDYGYAGRPEPIAVAPIWWVENVATYLRSQMPASKLLLGVPAYGYDWNVTKGPPATAVTHQQAMLLSKRPGATLTWNDEHAANLLKYKDDAGDAHEVWFEDARSFEAKLQIVTDQRLGGFALWRLGNEDPEMWTIVNGLSTPATRLPPLTSTSSRLYFPETGHTLAYGFLEYWNENGGLARFGYPRTEEFVEYDPMVDESYTVQYFERARFEYHPEYAGTQFDVLLGHIGRWAMVERGLDPWGTSTVAQSGARYFSETGHNLSGAFRTYWESQGGLYSFGFPLTEPFMEVNPEDGQTYLVQYFERARFEYHPEFAGTHSEVLLGLLGNEMLREREWIR